MRFFFKILVGVVWFTITAMTAHHAIQLLPTSCHTTGNVLQVVRIAVSIRNVIKITFSNL